MKPFTLPAAALLCLLSGVLFPATAFAEPTLEYYGGCAGGYTNVPPEAPCKLTPFKLTSKETVSYGTCGGHFDSEDFTKVPKVEWKDAEKKTGYTFVLVSDKGDWRCVVSNIPGADLREGCDISKYVQLMGYQPPREGSRYGALIYRQMKKIEAGTEIGKPGDFVDKFKLCGPKAALSFYIRSVSLSYYN